MSKAPNNRLRFGKGRGRDELFQKIEEHIASLPTEPEKRKESARILTGMLGFMRYWQIEIVLKQFRDLGIPDYLQKVVADELASRDKRGQKPQN